MKLETILAITQVLASLTLVLLISFIIILFIDVNIIANTFNIKIEPNENTPSFISLWVF